MFHVKPLKRPVRRSFLAARVTVSASWPDLTVGLPVLGLAAFLTHDAAMAQAATRAMKVFGDRLVVPVALLSLLSGPLLAPGTPWDPARHRWVWMKFWG